MAPQDTSSQQSGGFLGTPTLGLTGPITIWDFVAFGVGFVMFYFWPRKKRHEAEEE